MAATPGMPEYKGIGDRLKKLEAQVSRLSRARSMQSTSLDGGTFRVKNGGKIQLVNDAGDVVAELDKDSQTFFDSSGTQRARFSGGGVTLWDENGDLIWSSSLAWSAEIPPSTTARATSSSTTYQEVCRFYLPIATAGAEESRLERLRLSVDTDSSPTGDVGEIRVTAQTFEVSAFGGGSSHVLGTATFEDTRISGGAGTEIPRAFTFDGLNDDDVELVVEVRRQSGSGTVGAQVRRPLRIS